MVSASEYVHICKVDKSYIRPYEVINSKLKSFKSKVIYKLDIEKIYDHINLDFLLAILEKMEFGFKQIRWNKWCISTTHFSILINDSIKFFPKY